MRRNPLADSNPYGTIWGPYRSVWGPYGDPMGPYGDHMGPILVKKLLRSCDEVAQDSHEVGEKFSSNDP